MTDALCPKVLVVEDEWVIANHVATALGEAGYEVLGPVSQVDEALELLEENRPDAVVLDINLDGAWSFTVADHLSALGVPFAFMSGYTMKDLSTPYRDVPLLQKPVDATAIRGCVEALLHHSTSTGASS